jgi:uncharacterized membrane protein YfcA
LDWSYWYVFPFAIGVSTIANASGFSGAVLFQPFFNFVLRLPLPQSIATGVATEAIGMTSGASRYLFMRKVDLPAAKVMVPRALIGVAIGLLVFVYAPRNLLRVIVGLVVGGIALHQLRLVSERHFGQRTVADLPALRRPTLAPVSMLAGAFSAATGTGVAEMHQPLLEGRGGLTTKRANATAIFIEAIADLTITVTNLSLGNLRPEILLFSVSGVLVGAQLGAAWSPRLPDLLLKTAFALCVLFISLIYATTGLYGLL